MTDIVERLKATLNRPGDGSTDYDLNPDVVLPAGRKLRPAGVLVAVSLFGAQPEVILTQRSSALKHHPGQISFPGGKVDKGDLDSHAAALREAWEEIGLPQDLPKIVGELPTHETVTGFQITPVVALLDRPFEIRPEPGEVAEVFSVPLVHLAQTAKFSVQSRRWRGQQRKYYTVPFGPYYIWGATARILRGLAGRVQA